MFALYSPEGHGYSVGRFLTHKDNQPTKRVSVLGLSTTSKIEILTIVALVISMLSLVLVVVFIKKNRRTPGKITATELKDKDDEAEETEDLEIEPTSKIQGECYPVAGMSDLGNNDEE